MLNKYLNLKEKNPLLLISIISILIILFCTIMYFIFFRSPKDLRTMKNIGKNVSSINLSLNDAIKRNTIDPELSLLKLKENKEKLVDEKNKLTAISPSKKYFNLYDNLNKSLDTNVSLYEQTISILTNPSGNDIPVAFENLTTLKNTCTSEYSSCRNIGVPIYLEDTTVPFFNYTSNYINEIIKLKRDHDIKNSQKSSFLVSLDKCVMNFSKLNEDLAPAMEKVRKENRDLKVIVSDANKKLLNLNYLKNEYYSLTVPSEAMECFNDLGDVLSIYDIYINELLLGLNDEIKTKDSNNKHLENAFSKYKDLELSVEKFNKSYDSYKNLK